MRKKVLFISDHGDPLEPLGSEQAGGQNNYVKQLALALEEEGCEVDVATHWNSLLTPQVEHFGSACRVIRIAAGQQAYVPKSELYHMMPAFYEELSTQVALDAYDVVHTHYWLSGLVGSFIKRDWDLPWIHTNHSLGIAKKKATGDTDPHRLLTEKMILSSTDRILATTDAEKTLIEQFVGQPSPIHVIPIGVDEVFKPMKQTKRTQPYFAFAGRLQQAKGIFTLLKAFDLLVKKEAVSEEPMLYIAGGGKNCIHPNRQLPKNKKLREAVRGLEHRVKFLGPQNQPQLAGLFSNSVATVVPSFYESFGMVAAEAQACGRPVIASNVGGLSDVVKNQKTGLHVERKNPSQLAHAMAVLLRRPQWAQTLGENAVAHAEREFNWSGVARKAAELYEEVCHENKIILIGD